MGWRSGKGRLRRRPESKRSWRGPKSNFLSINSISIAGASIDVGMNSYNRYAFGAVGEYLYGGGSQADAPGYKAIRIHAR